MKNHQFYLFHKNLCYKQHFYAAFSHRGHMKVILEFDTSLKILTRVMDGGRNLHSSDRRRGSRNLQSGIKWNENNA